LHRPVETAVLFRTLRDVGLRKMRVTRFDLNWRT